MAAEIINPKEAETLRTVVGKVAKNMEDLTGKVDEVVNSQAKVESSLQDLATAKKSGAPVQYMEASIVEKTIENKLNSQLVGSKVSIDVRNATIGKESKEKIDGLIDSTGDLIKEAKNLVESNKAIKPRKPLLNITIHDGKKAMWFGVGLAGLFLIGMIVVLVWANKKVNSIQDQAFYWADRAYQAAVMNDYRHPGIEYEDTYNLFIEDADKAKEEVQSLESNGKRYQEWKQYLRSVIGENDSRDIRVLHWESKNGEAWVLYRFFDEETERSVHVWPDKKVEETTDKRVVDIATAQKYSKLKIWTVLREAPATTTE